MLARLAHLGRAYRAATATGGRGCADSHRADTVLGCRPRRRPRSPHEPPTRQAVARIRRRLRFVYGIPPTAPHHHPIAELVLTVLSQSTNDRNRDVAYLRLREFLPTWEQVRDAPVAEVERAIRPGGISKVKSVRLQAILRAIAADAARPAATSCRWTGWRRAPVGEGRDYLVGLPGVGRKTAACVLLFALGKREVPVDTHVSRVGIRLGCSPRGRRSRCSTTACSRSRPRGRSSSCTSTSCATAGAPATPAVPAASCARSSRCARAACCAIPAARCPPSCSSQRGWSVVMRAAGG